MTMTVEKMGFETTGRLVKDYHNVWTHAVIGGQEYEFRSKLEYKLAKYLQLLMDTGEINSWEYESHKFSFPDDSWLVDFVVRNNDDTFEYFECKGHVEPRTKKLLKLVNRYYPQAQITMVFYSKRDAARLGVRATSMCKRVCSIGELTRGMDK